jgi:Leucine-rich repeat (LRR) protein
MERLDLRNQGIESVPDEIKDLEKLKELILSGCYQLETLSASVSTLKLEGGGSNRCCCC